MARQPKGRCQAASSDSADRRKKSTPDQWVDSADLIELEQNPFGDRLYKGSQPSLDTIECLTIRSVRVTLSVILEDTADICFHKIGVDLRVLPEGTVGGIVAPDLGMVHKIVEVGNLGECSVVDQISLEYLGQRQICSFNRGNDTYGDLSRTHIESIMNKRSVVAKPECVFSLDT